MQPAAHVGAVEPEWVRFILYDVADADELVSTCGGAQPGEVVADVGCGEIDPPDNAGDQVEPPASSSRYWVSWMS